MAATADVCFVVAVPVSHWVNRPASLSESLIIKTTKIYMHACVSNDVFKKIDGIYAR